MVSTRFLNKDSDYDNLGVKKGPVEIWEDGRRNDGRPGTWELWYFDTILDDGTKVVMIFHDKHVGNIERGITPHCSINITLPDGTFYSDKFEYSAEEGEYHKGSCNVKIGPHSFVGNLKEYEIEIKPINGLGAKLKLTNLVKSWRPGSAYIGFGENDEQYLTWLCVVPKGKVSGEITVNGEKRAVSGYGYHDHQWANIHVMMTNNHWLWIRQSVGDYVVLVYDFVASKKFGYKRFPMFFVQDKEGNIVFENTDSANVKLEILEEYYQEETNKTCPKAFKYTFENSGKKVEYTVTNKCELEWIDNYVNLDEDAKKFFDQMELKPSYMRWEAKGDLVITGENNRITGSSDLIYEMMYNGKSYKEYV